MLWDVKQKMVSVRQSHTRDDQNSVHWLEMLDLDKERLQGLENVLKTLPDSNLELALKSREMVEILADLNMDGESLAAAYCVPFIQFNLLDKERLDDLLGRKIALLLSAVEKMDAFDKLEHKGKGALHMDNIRRMLLAMVEDVRAVVIKLAEQVCHLKAVKNAEEEVRVIAAQQAASIFAPLANRLGIGQLKWELEDLSFRYLHPDTYKKIARLLEDKRLARESYMENLVAEVSGKLQDVGINAQVYGRPKHIYSIYKKMVKKGYQFDQLFDIRAIRIMVDELQECYGALGIVHTNWNHLPKEFDDYVATPKANGYQSIHTVVVGPEGKTVEIQIRTHAMHQDAELGVAAHWKYKEGALPGRNSGYEQKISWLRKLLQWQEEVVEGANEADGATFSEELQNQVVDDRIYIFTPKGDVFDLPAGSTPLDFAYYIHSNVGHRCIGAKVFGRIVPFTHMLETGDQVEILTQKEPNPSRDWLNPSSGYIKSSRARSKIHAWFKHQDKDKNLQAGKELLEKELAKLNLTFKDLTEAIPRFNFNTQDELLTAVGAGDVRINQLLNFLQNKDLPETAPNFKLNAKPLTLKQGKNGIVVEGVGNLMSHMANCCQPVPGDAVVGYITQGRGIAVHRHDCEQFLSLLEKAPERVLDVGWGEELSRGYAVSIMVKANDRAGLMRDISSVVANDKVNVLNMNLSTDEQSQTASFMMKVEVKSLDLMNRLLSKLAQVEGVFEARRSS